MVDKHWWGYTVRYEVTKEFLSGYGLEIGPGHSPQRLPDGAISLCFDKREAGELTEYAGDDLSFPVYPMNEISDHFPRGADFVIAHNVLEHCPVEIAALMEWHAFLKRDGTMVISVPLRDFTVGDRHRPETPFRHVLADYLLDRGDAYETRQHVSGFALGWAHDGQIPFITEAAAKDTVSHLVSEMNRDGHDCHWHALSIESWTKIIHAAALFGGQRVDWLSMMSPGVTGAFVPAGEAIFVYRLRPGIDRKNPVHPDLRALQSEFSAAARRAGGYGIPFRGLFSRRRLTRRYQRRPLVR